MILALMLLLSAPAAASATSSTPPPPVSPGLVAVLELKNQLPVAEKESLSASYVTDLVRSEVLARGGGSLTMITRENILVLLQAAGRSLEDCEGECEVDTGRRLGADFVITGELLKFGSSLKLNLKMHQTRTGQLLGGAQASGINLDELEKSVGPAVARLIAPLNVEPRRSTASAQPAPDLWPWVFTRDLVQVAAGWAGSPGMGNGPTAMVRAFGIEAHSFSFSAGDSLTDSPTTGTLEETFKGWAVGISPLSLGTDRNGPSGVTFTYLEPYLLYRFGTAKSDAINIEHAHRALVVGNRFNLGFSPGAGISFRLGLDVGADALLSDGGVGYKGNPTLHLLGWVYAGLGYGAP